MNPNLVSSLTETVNVVRPTAGELVWGAVAFLVLVAFVVLVTAWLLRRRSARQ